MASREDQIYNSSTAGIKSATQGIVFMGTPHRGSNKAKWATIATNLMGVVLKDHNSKVVEGLVRGSETLERIQTSFNKFLITLPVWTCYEDIQYEKVGKVNVLLSGFLKARLTSCCRLWMMTLLRLAFHMNKNYGFQQIMRTWSSLLSRQTSDTSGFHSLLPRWSGTVFKGSRLHVLPTANVGDGKP